MKKAIYLAGLLSLSSLAYAAVGPIVPSGGSVEVLAIGKPSFIKIRGKGKPASGRVTMESGKLNGQFSFELGSIDTGITLRNEHMRDKYLEVQKYPMATLELREVQLPETWSPEKSKTDERPFKGALNLHGVTQETTGKFHIIETGAVVAEFKIKLSDFKIEIPEYMGIKVADEVAVTVNFENVKVEPQSPEKAQ